MDIHKALMIIDPDTRDAAMAAYAGDCAMRAAAVEEACRMVAEEYRTLSAERDAAVRDTESLMAETTFICRKYCAISEVCPMQNPGGGLCTPTWRGPQQEEVAV